DLPPEALERDRVRGYVLAEELEGDLPLQLAVVDQVHGPHPAAAQQPDDLVTGADRRPMHEPGVAYRRGELRGGLGRTPVGRLTRVACDPGRGEIDSAGRATARGVGVLGLAARAAHVEGRASPTRGAHKITPR